MTYRERKQLFEKLTDAMEQQDWEKAIQLSDRLRAEDPDDREMWNAMLAAYIDGHAVEQAAEAGRAYAAHFPHDGKSSFYLGRIALLQDDWETAEREFQAALASPDLEGWYRGAAYSIYATFCREAGRPEEAARFYRMSCSYKDLAHGKATEYSNMLFNLHYLEKNADSFGLPNVRLVRADVLQCPPEGLPAPDLIVSNPPYFEQSGGLVSNHLGAARSDRGCTLAELCAAAAWATRWGKERPSPL